MTLRTTSRVERGPDARIALMLARFVRDQHRTAAILTRSTGDFRPAPLSRRLGSTRV